MLGVGESPRCTSAGFSQRTRRNPITGKGLQNYIYGEIEYSPDRGPIALHVCVCGLRAVSADRCVLLKASSPKSAVGVGERRGPSVYRLLQAPPGELE